MARSVKRTCDCQACRAAMDAEFGAIVSASFTSDDLDGIVERTIAEYSVARLYAFLQEEETGEDEDDGS